MSWNKWFRGCDWRQLPFEMLHDILVRRPTVLPDAGPSRSTFSISRNVKITQTLIAPTLLLLPCPECFDDSSAFHRAGCAAASRDSSWARRDAPFAWTACDWDALAGRCSRWPITETYPNVKYLKRQKKNLIEFMLKQSKQKKLPKVMNRKKGNKSTRKKFWLRPRKSFCRCHQPSDISKQTSNKNIICHPWNHSENVLHICDSHNFQSEHKSF